MKYIENGVNLRVECIHPDDSTRIRYFTVEGCDIFNDADYLEWKGMVIREINQIVNSARYWHEVRIYECYTIEGKIYEVKLK